jgi:hypothetical protein
MKIEKGQEHPKSHSEKSQHNKKTKQEIKKKKTEE